MIDLIVVLIIAVFALVGYKRGLIESALTLLSSVAALVLSFIVYPIINMFLKLTPLYMRIYGGTFEKVKGIDFGKGIQSQGNAILENVTWIPNFLAEQIKNNNNTAMYDLLGVTTIQEYISTFITNMIISLIAILVTWILLKVVLAGVLRIIGSVIEHLPVISSFNHLGGLAFGIIKGLLTLSIIGLIIPLLITLPTFQEIEQLIEGSMIAKWMYENNLIILIYNQFL